MTNLPPHNHHWLRNDYRVGLTARGHTRRVKYKYVCVPCRHTAKLDPHEKHPCPTCGKFLELVDNCHKLPKKTDKKGWLHIQSLITARHTHLEKIRRQQS